mmetsp:Transcript_26576/g.60697  ORF Transcript_26576/g.60697 Transcript_26576/m.60697 type:complete len:99 (-) Transcript_26576:1404-1700(-)
MARLDGPASSSSSSSSFPARQQLLSSAQPSTRSTVTTLGLSFHLLQLSTNTSTTIPDKGLAFFVRCKLVADWLAILVVYVIPRIIRGAIPSLEIVRAD